METDSPDLVTAKRLLDDLKLCGFAFRRVASVEDAPLVGNRVSGHWMDTIHLDGFSRDCAAWRTRTSTLIIPGRGLVDRRVEGSALTVLTDVLTWEPTP
ncbi:MAG: hypothetical protein ABIZ05_13100 [Pseudonocardiaceae bacterium]